MHMYVLDGRKMKNAHNMLTYLHQILHLPVDIAIDLEAILNVLLTYQGEKIGLMIIYPEVMIDNLGKFGFEFVTYLKRLKHLNSSVKLYIRDPILEFDNW